MTDCPSAERRDLLPDFLHGRLTLLRRVEVVEHLAVCADCRAELALIGTVRALGADVPPMDIASIVSALPSYRAATAWRTWRAAAAVAAVVLGGSTLVIARHAQNAEPGVASVERGAPLPAAARVRVASADAPESAAAVRRALSPDTRAIHSLAVEGAVGDLSDRELRELLAGLGSLQGMPSASADADNASLAPASARGAL